ncbi:MAG: aminoacyl-tRNA hydrolase [Longimicrobiales bacterium]
MKVVCGLGNPGPEYDGTRHNVGWWVLDRLAVDWEIGPFRRSGAALTAQGVHDGTGVLLMKPLTYMNRSGAALAPLVQQGRLHPETDLLVIVDDAALEVGRLRLRPGGSAGGHNGLKSVEGALGTRDYARLRIGVGPAPSDADLADWVLSPPPVTDEDAILALLSEAVEAVEAWIEEGITTAMSRYNR